MKNGHAIIGANYGDEGKGLLTDFFAARHPHNSLVVRFNGGAQAGHTVVCPDGRRHVFSHFGAGSFAQCPTYLSQFFIVNPVLFVKEWQELRDKGVHSMVIIDKKAPVTTPFDMFINQQLEFRRGVDRHGSCGVGINETMTRCLRSADTDLRVEDLLGADRLFDKLMKLSDSWLLPRLKELRLDLESPPVKSFLANLERITQAFISDVCALLNVATVVTLPDVSTRFTDCSVIFEGAQGLMLDEDRIDQFPHLTRSKTGLPNVIYLARRLGLEDLAVTYVTRSYLTRHGAGPLPGECDWFFADRTNIPNQFQGSLRFAPLDWQELARSITLDLSAAQRAYPSIKADMALTWLDELEPCGRMNLSVPIGYQSYGPTRCHIQPGGGLKAHRVGGEVGLPSP